MPLSPKIRGSVLSASSFPQLHNLLGQGLWNCLVASLNIMPRTKRSRSKKNKGHGVPSTDSINDWVNSILNHLRHYVGPEQLAQTCKGSSIMWNPRIVYLAGIPTNIVVNPISLFTQGIHPSWLEHYMPTSFTMGYQRSLSESSIQTHTGTPNRISIRNSSSNDIPSGHQSTSSDTTNNCFGRRSNNGQFPPRRKEVDQLRWWENVDVHGEGTCFTVMSYNVLAQELLTQHPYLYRLHNPQALQWEVRWSNLMQEITKHDADILCLQEVQESHIEHYFNSLSQLGYAKIYKRRTGYRCDGCAIFYKESKFTLVEYTTVEYNQPNVFILNRDNVAIIARFSPRCQPASQFVVATTHLLYNPRREDIRMAQTQLLLTEVDRISYMKPTQQNPDDHVPIIITGDFNLQPDSAVYELITRGRIKYDRLTDKTLRQIDAAVTTPVAGKTLVPPSLEITDKCQHAEVAARRKTNVAMSRAEEECLIKLFNSARVGKCGGNAPIMPTAQAVYCSGTLRHYLNLKSAFRHWDGDSNEGTSFQDQWVTVDYIFYSGAKGANSEISDDKLKMIGRYKIPTAKQLEGVTIPNLELGSDHLSLLVRFKLMR